MNGLWEWRAHVAEDWQRFGARLFLLRSTPDGVEVVTGFDEQGLPVITTVPEGTVIDFPGFALDRGARESLAAQLRPGPSEAEMKRLEEALAVERVRVDRLTDDLVTLAHAKAAPTPGAEALDRDAVLRIAYEIRHGVPNLTLTEAQDKWAAELERLAGPT